MKPVNEGYGEMMDELEKIYRPSGAPPIAKEALKDLIGSNTHPQITELPQEYQWLRISLNKGKDSPNKKVIHWTGPKGKKFIREHLQHGRKYTGQEV